MAIQFSRFADFLLSHKKYVIFFFIVFYFVGIIGLALRFSNVLFIKLVPIALLLSLIALFLFHQHPFDKISVAVFTAIGLAGYGIEIIGVNTHLVFGHYSYGNALGVKIFNTPLLIGLNWLMLSYAGSSMFERIKLPGWLKILMASLFVLLYDIILERVAPALDMWYWENNSIPLRNYIAWFIISMIFQAFIKVTRVKTTNSLAFMIMLMQVTFFCSLMFLFNFTK